MSFYVLDVDGLSADGPFADRDGLVEDFNGRAEDEREELVLAELNEDGTMSLFDLVEYLGQE